MLHNTSKLISSFDITFEISVDSTISDLMKMNTISYLVSRNKFEEVKYL